MISAPGCRKLIGMTNIVELAPVFAEADSRDGVFVQGIWNSRNATVALAHQRGHSYWRPAEGGVGRDELDAALELADVVVIAPTAAAATGMRQPVDGAEAGRIVGHRLLDGLSADRPDVHVVLVSHFLVGHGVAHHNAKPQTWGLRALEAHLRGGRNPWTILRPTWLSTIHDASYQIRLSGDQHADGLVSTASVAAAVVAAVENPRVSAGRTAAIFNLSIPGAGDAGIDDLATQFSGLDADFEAKYALQTVGA